MDVNITARQPVINFQRIRGMVEAILAGLQRNRPPIVQQQKRRRAGNDAFLPQLPRDVAGGAARPQQDEFFLSGILSPQQAIADVAGRDEDD